MNVYMDSHVGIVRENNEDSCKIINLSEKACILAVADGMGGYKKGEVASSMAVEYIEKYFLEHEEELLRSLSAAKQDKGHEAAVYESLRESINLANTKIFEKAQDEEFKMMGTTVVLSILYDDKAYIANVGDSRCYQLKQSQGNSKLYLITKDNSLVQELLDLGELTIEEAEVYPQKNIITRAVGVDPALDIDTYKINIEKNNIVLLCSDGLSGMLSDIEIEKILKQKDTVKEKVTKLIEQALKNGGRDNVTVICAEINEVENG